MLKLARSYITESIESKQNYKLAVDKWDSDYFGANEGDNELPPGETESELIKRQNLIEDCKGSELLISILKSKDLTSKVELLNETLLLGIAYLFGGNTHCQNSLLNVLKEDKNNEMLLNFRRLITYLGNFLIEIRKTKESGKKRSFAYNIVDCYDFYDIESNAIIMLRDNEKSGGKDKFEAKSEASMEAALCRIFRFMQLFCENNNINMKKFLLVQTNFAEDKGES